MYTGLESGNEGTVVSAAVSGVPGGCRMIFLIYIVMQAAPVIAAVLALPVDYSRRY